MIFFKKANNMKKHLYRPDVPVVNQRPYGEIESALVRVGFGAIYFVGTRGSQYYLFPVFDDGTISIHGGTGMDEYPYPTEMANIVNIQDLGIAGDLR